MRFCNSPIINFYQKQGIQIMKKSVVVSCGAIALTILSGCCFTEKPAPAPAPVPAVKAELPRQKMMFLPEAIYAVPGLECNIYFKNIFLAANQSNFLYDVKCNYGKQELKRWTYSPADKEAGKSFPLQITVSDQFGNPVASGKTTVYVTSAKAALNREVSILMIGDSLTNATVYPTRLHELCRASNAPKLKMIGSHSGSGRKVSPGGVAHEGYGGWKWQTFMNKYNPNATGRYKYASCSKFLFPQADGKLVFDVNKYLEKYNNGAKPDIVTFQLGVNDVFWGNKDNLDKFCADILITADKLIAEFRKVLPNAIFGVGFVTQGADQDAFGHNYKCGQTAWDYYRNSMRLNQLMQKHFASYNDPKLFMIPVSVALDTENNFPARKIAVNSQNTNEVMRQNNGVHPAAAGYRQMGDVYYAWLKYILSKKM